MHIESDNHNNNNNNNWDDSGYPNSDNNYRKWIGTKSSNSGFENTFTKKK